MQLNIGIFAEYYPNTFKPYIDWQILEFMKQGHKVTIYAHSAWDKIIDQEVIQYNLHKKVIRYPSTLKTLPKILHSLRPLKIPWYFHVAKIIQTKMDDLSLKKKIIATFRGFVLSPYHDVCLINDLATASYFTFIKDLLPNSCVAVYYHGAPLPGVYKEYMRERERIFAVADIIFTPTNYSAKNLLELGCPKEKIIVVPVGLNLAKFNPPKARIYKKDDVMRILSVGRLSPEKGFLYAIEAINIVIKKGFNNLSYTIIGQGPQERELREKIKSLGLTEKISVVGAKSNTEVIKYLAQSDVFLLPSVPYEGCTENQGTVIQEAQAIKVPVIATNVGGIPEGLLDGKSGFLIEPFSPKSIAEKLIELISLPSEKFAEFGENGRKFVESKYPIEYTINEICSHIINWLTAKRS